MSLISLGPPTKKPKKKPLPKFVELTDGNVIFYDSEDGLSQGQFAFNYDDVNGFGLVETGVYRDIQGIRKRSNLFYC